MGSTWFVTSFLLFATIFSIAKHIEAEQGLNPPTLHLPLYHLPRHHHSHKSENLFGPNSIRTPLKAASLNTGNYIVNISLGTPPRYYPVIVDTGSSLSWVQCKPCLHCTGHKVLIFDPSLSTTFKTIHCSASECSLLKEAVPESPDCSPPKECSYTVTYADDSKSSGSLSRDLLTLSPSETLSGFVYGCGEDDENRFDYFGESTGLIGMSRNELSMISQLSGKYGHDFSYCLPTASGGSGGSLSIGQGSVVGSSYKFTPMQHMNCENRDSSLYYLLLSSIVVGNKTVAVADLKDYCNVPTVIDSATEVTRLPPSIYVKFRDEFKRIMSSKNRAESNLPDSDHFLDTCYKGSLQELSADVPEIRMVFQGKTELTLAPGNVLVEDDGGNMCLAFANNSKSGGYTIIGSYQLQTYSVAYDVSNSRIGFAAGGCS